MNKRKRPQRRFASLSAQGERVAIRPWKRDDTREQQSWSDYSDPFSEFWNLPKPLSLGDEFLSLLSPASGSRQAWAIEDEHHQLIGRISLREIEFFEQRARLGISLAPTFVGQGRGTEVLTLFLDHFFGPLGFTSMLLDVAAFNRRAVRCYERLGFHLIRHEWRKAGHSSIPTILHQPAYHHLRPFFRYENRALWVQFLEMELQKRQWLSSRMGHPAGYPAPAQHYDQGVFKGEI